MIKRFLLIALVIIISIGIVSYAEEVTDKEFTISSIKVAVDGKVIDFPDQQPILMNDRTYIPIRFLAEALGATVEWNGEYERVDIINGMQPSISADGNTKISYHLKLGKAQIVFAENDKRGLSGFNNNPDWDKYTGFTVFEIENAPFLLNDRTMLPFRFVAEALGAFVYYDGNTGTAHAISNWFDDTKPRAILASAISPYVLTEVNRLRAEVGVNPVSLDGTLVDAATWKVTEMVNRGYYSHENKGYPGTFSAGQFFALYPIAGFPLEFNTHIGENIFSDSWNINTMHNNVQHQLELYPELKNNWGFNIALTTIDRSNRGLPNIIIKPNEFIKHYCESVFQTLAQNHVSVWKESQGHYNNMIKENHTTMGYSTITPGINYPSSVQVLIFYDPTAYFTYN